MDTPSSDGQCLTEIDYNLSLSPDERIIQHQQALDLYFEILNSTYREH